MLEGLQVEMHAKWHRDTTQLPNLTLLYLMLLCCTSQSVQ
jgi:hypothetical protein